jgi:molybdopterin-guanine dinucleotide biosynthesis protein A
MAVAKPAFSGTTLGKKAGVEICILAGGLSTRMGRDKARLRLGSRTMLGVIQDTARRTGLKVRTLRRDLVPRCGPLGGIYSALKTTSADMVVFLACDMPFVREEMIDKLTATAIEHPGRAIFFTLSGNLAFPFLVPRAHAAQVAVCIEKEDLSIQSLRKHLPIKIVPCRRKWLRCLENINTPEELTRAKTQLARLR